MEVNENRIGVQTLDATICFQLGQGTKLMNSAERRYTKEFEPEEVSGFIGPSLNSNTNSTGSLSVRTHWTAR